MLQGTIQFENTSVSPFCTIIASAKNTKLFGAFSLFNFFFNLGSRRPSIKGIMLQMLARSII